MHLSRIAAFFPEKTVDGAVWKWPELIQGSSGFRRLAHVCGRSRQYLAFLSYLMNCAGSIGGRGMSAVWPAGLKQAGGFSPDTGCQRAPC